MKPRSVIAYSTANGMSEERESVTIEDKPVALVKADNFWRAKVKVTPLFNKIVVPS